MSKPRGSRLSGASLTLHETHSRQSQTPCVRTELVPNSPGPFHVRSACTRQVAPTPCWLGNASAFPFGHSAIPSNEEEVEHHLFSCEHDSIKFNLANIRRLREKEEIFIVRYNYRHRNLNSFDWEYLLYILNILYMYFVFYIIYILYFIYIFYVIFYIYLLYYILYYFIFYIYYIFYIIFWLRIFTIYTEYSIYVLCILYYIYFILYLYILYYILYIFIYIFYILYYIYFILYYILNIFVNF